MSLRLSLSNGVLSIDEGHASSIEGFHDQHPRRQETVQGMVHGGIRSAAPAVRAHQRLSSRPCLRVAVHDRSGRGAYGSRTLHRKSFDEPDHDHHDTPQNAGVSRRDLLGSAAVGAALGALATAGLSPEIQMLRRQSGVSIAALPLMTRTDVEIALERSPRSKCSTCCGVR